MREATLRRSIIVFSLFKFMFTRGGSTAAGLVGFAAGNARFQIVKGRFWRPAEISTSKDKKIKTF